MRRILTVLFCCLLLAVGVCAAGEDITIDSYQADARVSANGQAQMTVTVQMTIPTAVSQLDLPVGAGTEASVSGHKAKRMTNGNGVFLRLSFDTPVSGVNTFVLTYTLKNTFTDTENGQRFAADLISPGWAWPMTKAAFQVTMPSVFTQTPAYVGGYYGDTVDDYLDLTCNSTILTGTFTEAVKDHDSLKVTLDLPTGYFTPSGAQGISSAAALVAVLLLAAACAAYWALTLRSGSVRKPIRPLPPDGAGAGDLPMLLTCGRPDLALQAAQWASMGYLGIYLNNHGRVVLRKRMEMGSERRKREQAIFAALFSGQPYCDAESLRFQRLGERYADATRVYWERRLFSRSSGSPALLHGLAALACGAAVLGTASGALPAMKARWLLLVLAAAVGIACGRLLQRACVQAARRKYRGAAVCAVPTLVLLVLAHLYGGQPAVLAAALVQVFAALSTLRGGRRSTNGQESLAQTLGFRRYLQNISGHQALMQLRRDSQFFYKFLPCAESMGLGERFAAQFGEEELEPCDWLAVSGRAPTTAPAFYRVFKRTLIRMQRREAA